MKQFNVTGMSCAACSARVEKAVKNVPGVTACAVSLLTNSMGVEGSAEDSAVIAAVEAAGYGASLKGGEQKKAAVDDGILEDRETPVLKRRVIASVVFLIVLMYISMGHMMWGWPLPGWFDGNHVAMGLVQLLLAGIIMVINQKFFISGFKSLWHRSPNMDSLVALGSAASFGWSVYALFAMTRAQVDGNHAAVMNYMMEFYFESAATILTLITVGKMLEARSKGKTTDALKGLIKLSPDTAVVLKDGEEQTVPVEQVRKGDVFVVRPGENIPVDGVVIYGSSAVNEAALTGESIPAEKNMGDHVFSGTVNSSGYIRCEAVSVGEDTTLSKIIKTVEEAAATKAPIAKIADKVSGVFVPAVIILSVITAIVWLLAGKGTGFALARAISVLVISCPCALGLATPVAIMVGNGMGAKNGILFKNAVSLEETGRIQLVALDKTGTITKGEPEVTDVFPANGFAEEELLKAAAALEAKSEHPLAGAVMRYTESKNIKPSEVSDFAVLAGNGVSAVLEGKTLEGGSVKFISGRTVIDKQLSDKADELAKQGKTPLLFAQDGKVIGLIAAADVVKEDSPQAVRELQNMGIQVVMLTGDNKLTAEAVGAQAGVDRVIAGVLPDEKEKVIRTLQQQGKTAMVGDGINDAPALIRADIGIAIGAGTDIAIDAADIVLMKSRLSDVPAAIRLSRATLRNIRQNLFWAFFYNVLGIPLAAGVWIPIFGWTLNPMFGAAAMSLSSFCVVTNALRLNRVDIRSSKKDKKIKAVSVQAHNSDEQIVTLKIDGMMCGHCEGRVKAALEKLAFVSDAQPDFNTGTAKVTLNQEPDFSAMKKAVKQAGYRVIK